ncbi:MAG: Na+/H+ antiporter subunit E [Candidatus Binatia bacterium]
MTRHRSGPQRHDFRSSWQAFTHYATRIVVFTGLWWLLTGGQSASWIIGIPTVIAATWASAQLQSRYHYRWQPLAVLYFLAFFVWQSVRGGVDVACRALSPQLSLAPGLLVYRLHLPAGFPRVVVVNIISLLPGTLSVALHADRITVHTLSGDHAQIITELRDVEHHVARMFAIELVQTNDKAEHNND